MVLAAIVLIVVVSLSLFVTFSQPPKQATKPFYVGVEFAYSDHFAQVKALVDKVKDYTNLLVIGDVGISFNRSALDQSADYIASNGLSFIVLFTSFPMYFNYSISEGWSTNYTIFNWMQDAPSKYGDKFLGIYRYDEPGGNQLDNGTFRLIQSASSYSEVSQNYVGNLSSILQYYYKTGNLSRIYTSDYGLNWFDYNASYNTVFAEFLGNETGHTEQDRQQIISFDRGAAESFGKDWGVIITWQSDHEPYLENGSQLYSDLTLAYSAGAKYAVVFSYPNTTSYGTLEQEHFDALQKFWNVIHTNPNSIAQNKATVAYVLPKDYGFGFRYQNDTIWGLFPPDNLTQKVMLDIHTLLTKNYSNLNIIYDDPAVIASTLGNYTQVYYWNETIT